MKEEITKIYVFIECPICKGKGKVKRKRGTVCSYTYEEIKTARRYYKQGMSLRKIAKKMNIKHPQTISNLIRNKII